MPADPQMVYKGYGGGSDPAGNLFAGKTFWLSKAVPQRSHFSDLLKRNGGQIVASETGADIKIVDHLRKHAPSGTYSFQFISESVDKGRLQPLENYAVGPRTGTVREVASGGPTRGSRVPFTADDDKALYDWVKEHESKGSKTLGNEIYKELERVNPRHTFQSWRDRWVKYLRHRSDPRPAFTAEDFERLLAEAPYALALAPEIMDEAWEMFAKEYSDHTAAEWRAFFEERVAPEYDKSVPLERNYVSEEKSSSPLPSSPPPVAERGNRAALAAEPRTESPLFCTPGPGSEVRDVANPIESIEPREVGEAVNRNSTIQDPNVARKRRSDNTDRDVISSSPRDSLIQRRSKRRRLSGWASAPIEFAPAVNDPNVTRKRKSDAIEEDEAPSSPRNNSMEPQAKRRLARKICALIENAPTSGVREDGYSPEIPETFQPHQVGDEVDVVSSGKDVHDTGRNPTSEASAAQGPGLAETPQSASSEGQSDLIDLTLPSPRGGWRQHDYGHVTGPAHAADEVQETLVSARPFDSQETISPRSSTAEEQQQSRALDQRFDSQETIIKGRSLQYERIPRSSPPHLTPPIKRESEDGDIQYDVVDDVERYYDVEYYDDDTDNDEREDERTARSPSEDSTAANEARAREDAAMAKALDEWIDAKVSEGFDEQLVLLALRRTTLDGDLAEIVLEHNREYSNNINNNTTPVILLPTGIPGIWTEDEDEDVTSGDPDRMRAMIAKHGLDVSNERYIFLQLYRTPGSSKRTSISSAGGDRP